MSNITEERIREIIREELASNLSIDVETNTETVDGEYIKFVTGVSLTLGDEVISWSNGY